MSIEERAEEYVIKNRAPLNSTTALLAGYTAGSTEQQALSEARIKELEGIIISAKQLIEAGYIGEALDLLETKSKALNKPQQ